METVKNIIGISDKKCKCRSWLKHWVNNSSKSIPPSCRVITCSEKELVGAHVKKINNTHNIRYVNNTTDNNRYIVPLCISHSKSNEELDIVDGYLVSANKSETCAKLKNKKQ